MMVRLSAADEVLRDLKEQDLDFSEDHLIETAIFQQDGTAVILSMSPEEEP